MTNLKRNSIGLVLVIVATVLAAHGCGLNPQPEPPLGAPTAGGLGEDNMGSGGSSSPSYGQDAAAPSIPPNAAGDGDLAAGDGDPAPGDGDLAELPDAATRDADAEL